MPEKSVLSSAGRMSDCAGRETWRSESVQETRIFLFDGSIFIQYERELWVRKRVQTAALILNANLS